MKLKRFGTTLLALTVLTSSVLPTVPFTIVKAETVSETVPLFEDDFSNDVVGEVPLQFDVVEAGGTVRVVVDEETQNQYIHLDDTSTETNVQLTKKFADVTNQLIVEMDFMQDTYTNSTKIMRLKGQGTPIIIETDNGAISYRVGNDFTNLVTIEENVWYSIKLTVDLTQQVAHVEVNGETVLENAALNQASTRINTFETFTPNGGAIGHYVDNIKFSTVAVPEPPVEEEPPVEVEPPIEEEEPGEETPAVPVASGIYEAEDALFEGVIIDNKHLGFTGTGFIDYNPNAPGGWVEWTVNVPADGEYTLDFRYAHGGTDPRPAEISVNGEVVEPSLPFDPTGGFAIWTNTSMKANLTAGENKIRALAIAPGGGGNIDHLRVYQEFDQTLEAEEALLEEGTVIVDNKHAGFTGTGFIDYNPNAPGSWIEFTVDVPLAGEYTLAFRYAHGGTDPRPAEIKINDTVVVESLAFDPTGAFTNWGVTSTKVALEAGTHKIRVTGIAAGGGANIDHLRIHNLEDSEEEGPTEIDQSEMEEVVSGVELKKLKELGLLVDQAPADDAPISRIAFLSLINDAFGFVPVEKYKGISNQPTAWDGDLAEWDRYVVEIAGQIGYADSLLAAGNLDAVITKDEAQSVLAGLLDRPQMAAANTEALTWGEARTMVEPLMTENMSEEVRILDVQAISNNLMAIILNGHFEDFTYSDIEIVVPSNDWDTLSPNFRPLRTDKAAIGMNQYGQTVLVVHSLDAWDENGQYVQSKDGAKFSGDLNAAITQADNLLTWQMENGGWTKNWPHIYTRPWNGTESRSEWVRPDGIEIGTIDNDATIMEMNFLAQIYQETKDVRYKESIEKAMEFLFDLQYESGGFAQVYPERGNYSDYVTFNDDAMINVLDLLDQVAEQRYPFNGDLIDQSYQIRVREAIDLAVEYILEAQIEVDGELLAWGAQHDPVTYEPREARAYEHPSLSGSESIGIIRYLMSRPQTEAITRSVEGALNWLDEVKLENTRYVSGDPNNVYFVEDPNSTAWARFYEIGTNRPIFSGRDGIVKYDILEIEEERRNGYSWGGHWGAQLLSIAEQTGYFTDKVFVRVNDTVSTDVHGRTLLKGDIKALDSQIAALDELESVLVVAQDGSGDYATVQAAIDAVPVNNTNPVTIFIKDGIYKEVVTVPQNKPFITLLGESKEGTVLTYDNYAGRDNGVGGTLGTSGSASVYLRASDFRAENLTFENSFDRNEVETSGTQAVAVYASGDRMYFKNVRFLGQQDTLYTHSGTQYYTNVYIEGDVDFIFGAARIVIEDSIIHSLDRGSESNNGYVVAPSTLLTDDYGFLIQNSVFTSDAAPNTVYLGRPWPAGGNPLAIGSALIRNSELGDHIRSEGWSQMSGLDPLDARLFEYENYGPGVNEHEIRRQLTAEENALWTIENVLNGWDPTEGEAPDEEIPGEEEPPVGEEPGEETPGEEEPPVGEEPGEETPEDEEPVDEEPTEEDETPTTPVEDETETPAEETDDEDDSEEETAEKPEKLPESGANQFGWTLIGSLLVAAGAIVLFIRKRLGKAE